ncbi:MAG: hypothetical protein MOGMAGMI_02032 [Candidatus Omnitrophica bacterium]|jgi:hypothetical protein|nr:hypothetical protein [Candidatus Omnitrophota bacterium]
MDKAYKVQYKQELITDNAVIRPDGFSSIAFENVGDVDATINNIIPLKNLQTRFYNEREFVEIDTAFDIKFATPDAATDAKKLLVIYTYYIKQK